MDGDCETDNRARRMADRRLVRQLSRRYRRERDLALALPREVKDYELADRVCRWITAAILHRLNRRLRRELRGGADCDAGMRLLFLRACLRGEARLYREQSRQPDNGGRIGPAAPWGTGRC